MPLLHVVLLLSLLFAASPALAAEAYPPDGPGIPVVKNTEDAAGAFGQGLQTPPPPKPWDQESLWNLKVEGTVDNQGQPLVVIRMAGISSTTAISAATCRIR
jgi:hypothetical protein